ncbi:MFS transporter [Jiangella endophytica]|uniref:MFS transporter n=1 Tax=Jiangella endophytica TaxID=1623398 RepID=UPI000E3562B6|nr:MFS transporter [Jiangella endophytica]
MSPHQDSPKLVLAITCVAQFMVILNATIVVVALPAIQSDLGIAAGDLIWVVNAYLVTFGGFLLIGGRSADIFGRQRMLLVGTTLFTAASLWGATSTSAATLLSARAAQGLGAAVIMPVTLSLVIVSFPDGRPRRRALALWSAVNSGAVSIAFFIGGFLSQTFSWQAIFLANVPIGVALIVAVVTVVDTDRPLDRGGVDLGGALTITTSSVAAILTVQRSEREGWTDLSTLLLCAVTVTFFVAFIMLERTHPRPLVRLPMLRKPNFAVAITSISAVAGAMMATSYLLTLFFQRSLQWSPLETGLAYIPPSIALSVAALATAPLLQLTTPRHVLVSALLLLAGGAALLTRISPTSHYAADILPAMMLMYAAVGCAGVTLSVLVTTKIRDDDAGMASGVVAASHDIGGALWLAVFTSLAAGGAGSTMVSAEDSLAITSGYPMVFWAMAVLVALGAAGAFVMLRRWRPGP